MRRCMYRCACILRREVWTSKVTAAKREAAHRGSFTRRLPVVLVQLDIRAALLVGLIRHDGSDAVSTRPEPIASATGPPQCLRPNSKLAVDMGETAKPRWVR